VFAVAPCNQDPEREVIEAAAGGAVTATVVSGDIVYDLATQTAD
jgi:hypothetical protein